MARSTAEFAKKRKGWSVVGVARFTAEFAEERKGWSVVEVVRLTAEFAEKRKGLGVLFRLAWRKRIKPLNPDDAIGIVMKP